MKKALGKFFVFILGVSLIVGIVYVVLKYQDVKFRNVVVNEVMGRVTVSGGVKNGKLVAGEHLVDGDYVEVASESSLTLCADSNKFLRADPETSFKIETGNVLTGKGVRIVMDSGSTLSTLDEKLKEGEFWQVDTPTSSMAVRGTSFRVTVYKSGTQKTYTLLEVEKGSVTVDLKTADGKTSGTEELFEVGEAAVIRGGKKDAEFLKNKKGETKWSLNYEELPEESMDRLVSILEDAGEQLEPQPETRSEEPVTEAQDGHTHTPGGWEVTTPQSCTSDGVQVRRCTVCGEIMQSEIIPAGHDFETTYSYPDGCNNNGSETITCKRCGVTYMEVAYPRTHELDYSTVRETGGVMEVRCSICGQYVGVGAPSLNPPVNDPAQQDDPDSTYDDPSAVPDDATQIPSQGLDPDNQSTDDPPSGYNQNGGG